MSCPNKRHRAGTPKCQKRLESLSGEPRLAHGRIQNCEHMVDWLPMRQVSSVIELFMMCKERLAAATAAVPKASVSHLITFKEVLEVTMCCKLPRPI